mgnify:CR=1 FL=1
MGHDLRLFDRVLQRARCLAGTLRIIDPLRRDDAEQQGIDAQTRQLKLYEMPSCPYCCKVRRAMRQLGLDIPSVDIGRNDDAYNTLLSATDETQVPCLYIHDSGTEPRWLFESNDIVAYLRRRFGD